MSACDGIPDFNDLFPETTTCATGTDPKRTIYSLSPQYSKIREDYSDKFQSKFNDIIANANADADADADAEADKHNKLACLMHHMLTNIESTTKKYIDDDKTAEDKKKLLANEQKLFKEYEQTIKNNENSGLVTDYRNESTEKRNKKLNTYFTLYVTFIVIFLIVEGIVFFV
tara:strand:+ start:101 stop:616 length:516 start_codon:yes stop_codon:yes gene_type:complete